jgi:hypothetical protein
MKLRPTNNYPYRNRTLILCSSNTGLASVSIIGTLADRIIEIVAATQGSKALNTIDLA